MKRLIPFFLLIPSLLFAQIHNTKSKYYVDSQDSATSNSLNNVINVITFGAKGNGLADDYTAISAAITAALSSGRGLYFPAGTYITSSGFTIMAQNLSVRGDNQYTTVLRLSGTGPLFKMGADSTNPTNWYYGQAQGYRFSDITLDGGQRVLVNEGTRTRTGIKDNGSGGGVVDRVFFIGWKYGFFGSYGSDFTHFSECQVAYNDTGIYLGPGSQQTYIHKSNIYNNQIGLVNEGALQGEVNSCYFVDQTIADIDFPNNATTVSGIVNPLETQYELSYRVADCWFESNVTPGRIPPRHIYVSGTRDTLYPKYVNIDHPYLVSGGAQSASNAFLEISSGTEIYLDNLLLNGNEIKYVVKTTYYPRVYVTNLRTTTPYTSYTIPANKYYLGMHVNQLVGPGGIYSAFINNGYHFVVDSTGATSILSTLTVTGQGFLSWDGAGAGLSTYDDGSLHLNRGGTGALKIGDLAASDVYLAQSGQKVVIPKLQNLTTSTIIDSFKVVADSLQIWIGGNAYLAKRRGF